MMLLHLLSISAVLIAMLGGVVVGLRLLVTMAERQPGFIGGVLIGLPLVLVCGFMAAHLLGGWCEDWLGTQVGVPLGIFGGLTLGIVVAGSILGGFSSLLWRMLAAFKRVSQR